MITGAKLSLRITAALGVIALASIPQFAMAQDTAAANGAASATGSDIIVTTTKRGDSTIKDVPIAIQAFSAESLASHGATDFGGFYHMVPGLSVQDQGPGDKRYIIRGINATGSGTIGLYLDEVIITGANNQDGGGQQPDIKLFDLERVEVLKGPQGTTFGSSSMAGTIRYITKKPDLNEFGATINSSLQATKGAALGLQTDGSVNIPIVTDRFAIRVAGDYTDLPGYIDNKFERGVDGEKTKAGRISARLKITDDLTLDGMVMAQHTHQDGKSYFNLLSYTGTPLGQNGYEQANLAQAPWNDLTHIYNLTLNYKRDFGTFTVTGSRFKRDTDYSRDSSLAAQTFFGLPADGAGESQLVQTNRRQVDSFEARFASSWSSPIQILAGAFGQNENRHFRSYWPTTDPQGYPGSDSILLLDRTAATQIHERALFGEVSYAFTDALKFTAGARAFDIKLDQQPVGVVAAGGGAGSGPGTPQHTKDNGVIGRFNLAYKVTSNVSSYIQIAQGYRSGGTNDQTAADIAHVVIPAGFGSDSLWNYEAGVKASLFGHKLFVDAAAYYIDWSAIQVQAQATAGTLSFPYTANGGKASVKGTELNLELRPANGLRINATGNYSFARLTRDNPDPTTGLKGDRVPYVPKWSFSGGVQYEYPIQQFDVMGTVGGDISYTGSRATDYNSSIITYRRLPSYTLVSAHIGVKGKSWSAAIIGNNIFNNKAIIDYNNIVPGVYPDGIYINRPRTLMFSVSKSF
jgi:iron complex outermembrane recepter protein